MYAFVKSLAPHQLEFFGMTKKRILLISPIPTHPQHSGNCARVSSLISSLKSLDHEVYFVHIQETSGNSQAMENAWGDFFFSVPYKSPSSRHKTPPKHIAHRLINKLKKMLGNDRCYNYGVDDWYDSGINCYLSELNQKIQPHVIIVEYVFFSKALECFGSTCLKVIDTHDIFANRYKIYEQKGQAPQWFSTTSREESRGLKRADVIVAIQSQEAKHLSQQLKNQEIVTVGHLVNLNRLQRPDRRNTILFLASGNPINIDAFQYFVKEVFPIALRKKPDMALILAGTICHYVKDSNNYTKLGEVESLEFAYSQADLVVNPIRFGTGLKIKNIEALAFGKPLITSSIGAVGMEEGINSAFEVADNPEQFSEVIISILTDEKYYQKISDKAYAFASNWNQSCLKSLRLLIDSV
jgi:polysaccharide biosynthesis protein PslH